MIDYLKEAEAEYASTRATRRDLHAHPELGFNEIRTAGLVAKELENLGIEVTKGVAHTGVIGLLEGARPGPTLLLRFDMDALPILEETGAEYASKNEGIMHACGHDGHTAIGLSVARILTAHKDELSGTIKFCFQPSEESNNAEGIGGNELMISEGVLDSPRVDMCLAMHVWNEKPVGWLGIAKGPVMAGAEQFKIKLTGMGGHGAAPQLSVDPIPAAATLVNALQSIVSRNVAPLETAVVSVTMIHAGTTYNVIPSEVFLEGTIRTFDPLVREKVLKRFEEIVKNVSHAMACESEMIIDRINPALINQDVITEKVQQTAARLLPGMELDTQGFITMGAEDMAFMHEKIPGCFILVGSANHERGLDFGHHHPKFDFDELALSTGVALMTAAAVDLLK
jgi:amidohydrolase